MAGTDTAAWEKHISDLETMLAEQETAFEALTPEERMSQARKAFNSYSDDRYGSAASMGGVFPAQQRLLEIRDRYPREYQQLVEENTNDNLLLQEKLAFDMDSWNQDPITDAGLKDAAFKAFSPIGTHDRMIRGRIGGYQKSLNDRMAFPGYTLHGKYKMPAEAVISHEARHRIIPDTPGAKHSYNNPKKKDEEYRNRQIDELYRRKNPYYAPVKHTPEVPQGAMDYFNQIISDQDLPESDFFTMKSNPEMPFWDNMKTLF